MSTTRAAPPIPAGRILLVEDDPVIGSHLTTALQAHGYSCTWAPTAAAARAAAGSGAPLDLVLLDLGLPDGDGIDLARTLRLDRPDLVIVVLTARTDELDVITGLDAGADDYLTKPFRLLEVLARVRAHLRRRPPDPAADHPTGALHVDTAARRVTFRGRDVPLRAKEYDVLAFLAARPGHAVSRTELMTRVWDEHWFGSTKTLDVTVASLRQHLDDAGMAGADAPVLLTLRGFGYRLDPPSPSRTGQEPDQQVDPTPADIADR